MGPIRRLLLQLIAVSTVAGHGLPAEWTVSGPGDLLVGRNEARRVRTVARRRREPFSPEVPDFMLRLRERHSAEWMNFGLTENGESPNLGIITTIRKHQHLGTQTIGHSDAGGVSNAFQHQSMNFRRARIPNTDDLVAGSLRIPVHRATQTLRNTSVPVSVDFQGGNIREAIFGAIIKETNNRTWLHIPLEGGALKRLKGRRILRLRILLDTSLPLDLDATPYLLSFHRNVQQSTRLRRDAFPVDGPLDPRRALPTHYGKQNAENATYTRRKRNGRSSIKTKPRYLMNHRYITSSCQKRDLMVHFDAIGWSKWVIAPRAYNAGYCAGHCPFPLSSHFNTTNHAIILNLMYSLRVAPRNVPPPCCAPLTFSPQSLLYFDGNEVVLQVYENMIVETCGCR